MITNKKWMQACVPNRWLCSAVSVLLLLVIPHAAQALSPDFSSPATNTTAGATWSGTFSFGFGEYNNFVVTVLRGEHIVPQANVTTLIAATSLYVELEPLADASGRVIAEVVASGGSASSTTQTFSVAFQPVPPPPVELTLGFTDPGATSTPGESFTGSILFTPSDPSVWFSATYISDETVVPLTNVTFTTITSNEMAVTLQPLTNRSGRVDFQITGEDTFTTSSVPFSVDFKTYPPVIAPISPVTIAEDSSTNVTVYVTDPDTDFADLTVTASMVSSTNPNLFSGSTNPNFASPPGTLSIAPSGTNWVLTIEPAANMNGVATIRIRAEDEVTGDVNVVTSDFQLTVTPVPDRSVIFGASSSISFGDDVTLTNIFAGITIDDVDHEMPTNEVLRLTTTLANDQIVTFADGTISNTTIGLPNQVTSNIRTLGIAPIRYRGAPGTINQVEANIRVQGVVDGLVTNRPVTLNVTVINTPPSFTVVADPETVTEGGPSAQPFYLPFIFDPDVGDDTFTLDISLADPGQSSLLSVGPVTNFADNFLGLSALIRDVVVQAPSTGMTNASEEVDVVFALTDGYGGTTEETVTLTVLQAQTPPVISGIPVETVSKTDADPPFLVLPTVFVQDEDEGGQQFVQATLAQSDPAIGAFSQTAFPLQTPASLVSALREVTYTPTPGVLPVGAQADSTVTLTVTDVTGLSAQNNNRRIRITSVNSAPQIGFPPPIDVQPVLIPPADPLLPFQHVTLTNDDTNAVLFTVSIDDPDKGTLTNLGAFSSTGLGEYQYSGQVEDILASLTNLVYEINPAYLFPVDDPGGTVFTLQARDFALLTSTRPLAIQVQDEPRNHLVTRALNDGLPGSFTYALANIGNNDVITFALPQYPAVIRMPGATSTLINRNITIKGPGANLLRISGDGSGDGIPNRQLFRIAARVTIEGVTLADGTAGFGGAVLVQERGNLTLRNVAVVDSVAAQYGGGIDVDGGQLTLDGCYIGGNRLSENTGMSGAGVSVYSDKEILILNTTFGANQQPNLSGDGGGGLVVQNLTSGTPMNTRISHSTFAGNVDAAGRASAVLAVGFGTRVRPLNSLFQDFSGRNLDVPGAAEFRSQGGNLADDSTKTLLGQQGQSEDVFLLDHASDLTSTSAMLGALVTTGDPTPFFPLQHGSPAINKGGGSTVSLDQRGVFRRGVPDSGAIEYNAQGRLVINEIRFDDAAGVNFVELYVRRDSTPIDLASYSLYVDGVRVHDFGSSTIVGTNSLFSFGEPVGTLIGPGFGIIVAFSDTPVVLTSDTNPTPVVGASVTGGSVSLNPRGEVSIRQGAQLQPVARHSYLGTYLDPANGTNVLAMAGNSISLAPQFLGFALIPHGYIGDGPFAGMDPTKDPGANPSSPGADSSGTPFGQDNAEPLARDDTFTVGEDDLALLDVLANDFDSDGNDRLVIVDVSTASAPGTGDAVATTSVLGAVVSILPGATPLRGTQIQYDPRQAPLLQQLPLGVEVIDTFYYEIIDIGSAPVAAYGPEGGFTKITSLNHRLETGDEVIISGATVGGYNGTNMVTVLDDDTFTIPVAFAGNPSNPADRGIWETVAPRSPSSRSEARVSVRVIGANDPPVAVLDVITNVTERSTVRIMTRPERAGDTNLVFAADSVPAPVMLSQDLLSNDYDIDTDDSWDTLRVAGVLGALRTIANYTGSVGSQPVIVHAPAHGRTSGDEVLIANYGGHASYNGPHVVTVLDADRFTVPVFYVDNAPDKGVWVILNEATRYETETDVGATVKLALRADQTLDHIIYDANASAFLRTLAEGQLYTNRFWYAVEDSHGGIGIGPIDVIVEGVNDPPVVNPDPDSLGELLPIVDGTTNTLETVVAEGLDLMYTLPPDSGAAGRTNLYVLDLSGTLPDTIVLSDFFVTDEDTPLDIATADLLENVSDIDSTDEPEIVSVDGVSREQALLTLSGGVITYNPTASTNLQALAREEMIIDTFSVVVSDGMPDGMVTSLVAVLVIGLNDSPVANPLHYTMHHPDYVTNEDAVWSIDLATLVDRGHAVELDINQVQPDDRLRLIPDGDVTNPGQAGVAISPTNIVHDATVSALLNELADWQSFTNEFSYAITDNSFLFAVDDKFHVPAGTQGRVLDVLGNDRDYTDAEGVLTIVDAGPALHGGVVTIGPDGKHLVYSTPAGFVGDDYFRYIIENDKGDRNAGLVQVRSVVPARNGILLASDNRFSVAAGETVVLDVTANDGVIPYAGQQIEITQLLNSNMVGQPVLTNNTFVFTAGTSSPLVFSYEIRAGGEARARADVTVNVVERRGTLLVQDDAFSVLPGSIGNELDVLANDSLVTDSTAHLRILQIVDPGLLGTITTNATRTRLLYTPYPGSIGTESIRYVATDQIGGTGTGTVHIAIGRIEPVLNYYTLEATNTAGVVLDVWENNRVLPAVRASTLEISSVTPASALIGTMTVSGGTALVFTANGVIGQQEFQYEITDGSTPPRTATGRVIVESVGSGTYANPNVYSVRGEGSGYVFDVLTNDVSYPNVNKTYSIVGLGAGVDAPDAGGMVSIEDNKLVYTPAPGFFGVERFKYTMSDSVQTDVAEVVVNVRRGNLTANADEYVVFYELEEGTNGVARSFTLPVTLNDRIQPAFGQVLSITAIGTGTNAPNQGGSVTFSPDGLSLVYRPALAPTPQYTERFTYEISDGAGRLSEGVVRVRVRNRQAELVAVTQDDHFAVERNTTNNVLPVLANDFIRPGTVWGWRITSTTPSLHGGTTAIEGTTAVRYTPPVGFTGVDVFSYSVNDGLGGTGTAQVFVRVGSLPVLEDLFTVLSDATEEELDVLANDLLFASYAGEYSIHSVFGATAGGTVLVSTNDTVLYTPDSGYAGAYPYRETFFYRVPDDAGGMVTGTVQVLVHEAGSDKAASTVTLLVEGRNDSPWIENDALNTPITDKQTTIPFEHVTIGEFDQQLQERLDVIVSLDDADKGVLLDLGDFVNAGGGSYVLTNATAAHATTQIRQLIFEPTENRITVPTTETTIFTIEVTDNKSAPVIDTNSFIAVTAVNDPPVVSGTQIGQEYYYRLPIQPFRAVTVSEVDDLGLQPLIVTVTMQEAMHGQLGVLGDFVPQGDGVVRAEGITAAEATEQLRALVFTVDTGLVPFGGKLPTHFSLAVADGFAPTVHAPDTEVIAHHPFEAGIRPSAPSAQGAFGLAADVQNDFAIVGAPNASVSGSNSGVAFLYERVPGPSNSWQEVRQILPASVAAGHRFGRSVAMHGDWAAIGAVHAAATGTVYLFGRDQGGTNNWGEVLQVAPTNLMVGGTFGYSVALYGDLLAVGAPLEDLEGDGTATGAVFLFGRNVGGAGAWGEIMRWAPTTGGRAGSETGWSVALTQDTLVVGAPRYNVDASAAREGTVFVFLRDEGGTDAWGLSQTLAADNVTLSRQFGWDVSVAGNLLAIGAPGMAVGTTTEAGRVMLYERGSSTNAFALVRELERGAEPEIRFGHSVSVEKSRILVGAPHNTVLPNIGAAYLFERTDPNTMDWTMIEKLFRPDGSSAGLFGTVVALGGGSGLVGAPADLSLLTNQGYTFFYRFDYNTIPELTQSLSIDPVFRSHGSGASSGHTLAVSANVAWTATNNVSWITITGGAAGTNDGTVAYSLIANTLADGRSGTITVSGGGITRLLTVNQAGTSATLTISPSNRTHTAHSVTGQVITVSGTVPWTATANASWIDITAGATGAGGGSVVYSLAANTATNSRTGTITVSGSGISRTFTITQAEAAPSIELLPTSRTHGEAAVTGQLIDVMANVTWVATANVAWVTITGGATGTGNGAVTYSVAANSGTGGRSGAITVTDGDIIRTFTIDQDPASPLLTLSPTNRMHVASGATGETVTVTANVSWTAVANEAWIQVTSGAAGSGNGTVTYSVSAQPDIASRMGTITVTGGSVTRIFGVEQAGADPVLEISPASRNHVAAGSTGHDITVTANHAWTASTAAGWISITAGATGIGNGTVTYNVAANSGPERSTTISVASATITRTFGVTQAAGNIGQTLGQAIAPSLTWTSGGDATWFSQSAVSRDGMAAQSGAITHNQQSWMQTTVTGPGTLSFWWKVSSEGNRDFLRFYLNNAEQQRISGEVDWQVRSFPIPDGTHTLRWRFDKDGSGTAGSDAGWVDQVVWTPRALQRFDTSQPITGWANNRWSFMSAWNLSTGALEVSPRWNNGPLTWNHTADAYQQWIARFVYDEVTGKTTALAWYFRQSHIQ